MPRRTICITGCTTGGLGYALAKAAHAKGLKVFACSRTLESMEPLAKLGIETFVLDVTSSRDIQELKSTIAAKTEGKLDILVNNAGIAYPFAVSDFSMDRVRGLYNVNLFGVIEMTHVFLPLLVASQDACVVLVGSLAGLMPVPFNAAYNSAKAALHSFGDTLRVEMAPFNVKVINVLSGNVESNIMKPETLPDNSIYQPIKDIYQDKRLNKFQDGAISADVWAKAVIAESLKPKPKPHMWIGYNWFTVWVVSTFLPRTVFDSILSGMFGLTELPKRLAKKKEVRAD
jgi:1-acylglycerone phosphate reductase